jgi:hypothetical protein
VREWSLDDREKRKRADKGEVSIRQCSECFFVYRPAPKCPQCGHVAEVAKREIEVVEGTLAEVSAAELAMRRAERREESVSHTLADWQALAARRGYKPGWAYHRYQARQRRAA